LWRRPVYRLEKKFRFEASHQLPQHDGKCRRLHGHSWVGTLILEGDDTDLVVGGPKSGMLVDFGDVSRLLSDVLDRYLDHHHLNDTTRLENPTSELLAWWIYQRMKPRLPLLRCVRIEETCTSAAEYRQ
jgi:6-pyruvoyltetrahydropterin/6-carboxytetrahydropterin synthase